VTTIVRLAWLTVDLGRQLDASDLRVLDADERERAARFKVEAPRRVFVAARGVLRRVLAQQLERDPGTIRFVIGSHGKPHLSPASDLHFNLSHSGATVALATSRGVEVGVDVEEVTRRLDHLRLARRFFAESEIHALAEAPRADTARRFFHFWTAKEAVLKATGSGLSVPVRNVEIGPDPEAPPHVISFGGGRDEAKRWQLHRVERRGRWMATVAYRGQRRKLVVEELRR
jgi:4'-phosphopantetheinyl transferase